LAVLIHAVKAIDPTYKGQWKFVKKHMMAISSYALREIVSKRKPESLKKHWDFICDPKTKHTNELMQKRYEQARGVEFSRETVKICGGTDVQNAKKKIGGLKVDDGDDSDDEVSLSSLDFDIDRRTKNQLDRVSRKSQKMKGKSGQSSNKTDQVKNVILESLGTLKNPTPDARVTRLEAKVNSLSTDVVDIKESVSAGNTKLDQLLAALGARHH
jgi:hypothetical protein